MKKVAILCLAVSLLSSGCGTTQPERTGAIVGGAAIGNSVGGAIGGLVGDSRHGWRGSYRGSCAQGLAICPFPGKRLSLNNTSVRSQPPSASHSVPALPSDRPSPWLAAGIRKPGKAVLKFLF